MNRTAATTSVTIFRLTALWALCESGLGGWMHALHLPFTGFFVGAFAIAMISLIAYYSGNDFRQMIQATFLVVLVKAAVSPQSPLPAYIAVTFQGILGAVLFRFLTYKAATILLGILAMIESALQKIIIATIIFGNSLWQAVDSFFTGIVKELHLSPGISFSFWIIAIYTGVYAMWGLILGLWLTRLPRQIEAQAVIIRGQRSPAAIPGHIPAVKRKPYRKLIAGLVILLFITIVLATGHDSRGKAGYVILRTLSIVAILVWIVNPLFRWLMRRWVKQHKAAGRFTELVNYIPELRTNLRPAYQMASVNKGLLQRFRAFVLILIVLTLYPPVSEQ